MMSSVIRQEIWLFLLSVLHGASLALFYDLFRSLRRAIPHGIVLLSLEDFFFWMTAGFLTFCLAFSGTDGVIRGYVAAGIFLGAFFYHKTVSRWVVFVLGKTFQLAVETGKKGRTPDEKAGKKDTAGEFSCKRIEFKEKKG